jgi:hypothetical protein
LSILTSRSYVKSTLNPNHPPSIEKLIRAIPGVPLK